MKKLIAAVLLAVAILGLCGCAKENEDSVREEDIRAICELATLECYYNNVAVVNKEKDNIFQKDRKMWIEYEGKATIGIEMEEVEIKVTGNVVNVTIPDAKLLSLDYTFNENSYISSADGWLSSNEISTKDQQDAMVTAQEKMKQEILSNESLFIKAEDKAKTLIENYIVKMGEAAGQEYIIEWKD